MKISSSSFAAAEACAVSNSAIEVLHGYSFEERAG
jgi:hypothetical protein